MKDEGPSPVPFAVAFVALLVMAWTLAWVMGRLGPDNVPFGKGLTTGALMWLGFVLTSVGVNNMFRGAKRALTMIDGGHWLGVLLLQGAIIGLLGG